MTDIEARNIVIRTLRSSVLHIEVLIRKMDAIHNIPKHQTIKIVNELFSEKQISYSDGIVSWRR